MVCQHSGCFRRITANILDRYYCHQIINGQIQISNRNVLPNAVKKFFNERVFCTYEYEGLSQDTEETMFQLVQRGVALTPAEKMRAMSTEWAVFTRQYEEDYELIVNCEYETVQFTICIFNTRAKCRSRIEPLASGLSSPFSQ